jgi:hypothetical protein
MSEGLCASGGLKYGICDVVSLNCHNKMKRVNVSLIVPVLIRTVQNVLFRNGRER